MDSNTNLVEETVETLTRHGRSWSDVRWVGDGESWCLWRDFVHRWREYTYDNGYGLQAVNEDLVVVGDDWWLERHEYDGSEWWEFKTIPTKPGTQGIVTVEERD